jgi:hypothetical protein
MIKWKRVVHDVSGLNISSTKETKCTKKKSVIKEFEIIVYSFLTNLECLITAALGNPVVPDVKI